MTHALILLACLLAGWAISVTVLRLGRRLPRWGDRRAMHQLAIFSPLLALGLVGGWCVQMVLTGCLMFSSTDGLATLALMGGLGALLVAAGIRESWHIVGTRRRLLAVATRRAEPDFPVAVAALASRLGTRVPPIWVLPIDKPFACVAGVARPALFVSRWMLDHLSPDELEALVAHELAHLKHADNLLAWLDVILLRTFEFLPPVRAAWHESLIEREEAADAQSAIATGHPLALAGALVRVAEWRPAPMAGSAAFLDDLSA
ncbi:MAG: M56 family metallopeptidase, partial [Candidatus Sericytochromatia bacterium]